MPAGGAPAPPDVGSRRARHGAPRGANDAEDVLVEFAGEAGFEWCTSYIRRSRAVRSWPSLNRRGGEHRRRVVTSSAWQRGRSKGPATDFGLLAAVLKRLQSHLT